MFGIWSTVVLAKASLPLMRQITLLSLSFYLSFLEKKDGGFGQLVSCGQVLSVIRKFMLAYIILLIFWEVQFWGQSSVLSSQGFVEITLAYQ